VVARESADADADARDGLAEGHTAAAGLTRVRDDMSEKGWAAVARTMRSVLLRL